MMEQQLEWRAIAISELIDLLYLLNSDTEFTIEDFQQRVLLLSEENYGVGFNNSEQLQSASAGPLAIYTRPWTGSEAL